MLELICIDGVEDPIESQDGIYDHGGVVDPDVLEGKVIS